MHARARRRAAAGPIIDQLQFQGGEGSGLGADLQRYVSYRLRMSNCIINFGPGPAHHALGVAPLGRVAGPRPVQRRHGRGRRARSHLEREKEKEGRNKRLGARTTSVF